MRLFLSIIASVLSAFTITAYAETAPAANAFTMNTTAFLDKGLLPVLYTCDGKDKSPELSWTGVPAKTTSLALIVDDMDAPTPPFYHWVLYNIPNTVTMLPEGVSKLPAGVMTGKNSWGTEEYKGPCPPKGTSHTYVFTLYALDTKLNLPAGAEAKKVIEAMQNHIIEKVTLTAVYSRWLT